MVSNLQKRKNLAILRLCFRIGLMSLSFLVRIGILILYFLLVACSSRLVPKEKLLEYNEVLLGRVYVLKEDLIISQDESIKKGTKVRVFVESTPSLLKVKCYPVEESREYAVGRMAIYKINDEFEKKSLNFEDLELIISERFQMYEPPKKGKR